MAYNSGFFDEAKSIGEKFIRDFPNDRPIISPSASCTGFIKNFYPSLFHNTALHNEVKVVRRNMFEFTDFIINVLKIESLEATFNHVVTYHDSCASLREYGLKDQPRQLLRMVKGLELREMHDHDVCCGFGGTFAVKHEAISVAMTQQKVENAIETGAEYIVSTDSSCLLNMQAYIDKQNLSIKTIHIIDLLAVAMV
jgi:L-lactate dehydrogenase complex protein LldE